jgi:tRNA A-37 threonylcarbamoyl transferase component Bud32
VDFFEALIADFERAWQRGDPPDIGDYLRRCQEPRDRPRLVIELISVDLEYRWRTAASQHGQPPWTLADYAERLADLQIPSDLPIELIEEEYRARCRWGDKPTLTAFAACYRDRHPDIRHQLEQIAREVREEAGLDVSLTAELVPPPSRAQRSAIVPDARAPLVYSDYLLRELIGAGRTGRVYRATDRRSDRPVAIKYLRKSFQRIPDMVDRFINEARTVAAFQHPGIVRMHGVGQTPGGGYFIAMDFVDGPDLSNVLSRERVPITNAVCWTIEVCDALQHAHEREIIHCDLKPGNLLLDKSGQVRVTDFGLSRPIREDAGPLDRIEGTCGFMAPEQVSGWWGPLSIRTDVYGLGAVLFNLLTGEPPYAGATIADVLAQVVSGIVARSPNGLQSDVPPAVNEICLRCLAKRAELRYETMAQLAAALREALAVIQAAG